MICPECQGKCYWYGLAPHKHDLTITGGLIGSTVFTGELPDNFKPDIDDPKMGVYTCETCNGTGEINDNNK